MGFFDFFKKKKKAPLPLIPKDDIVARTKEELKEKFSRLGLERFWDSFEPFARNSICFMLNELEDNKIGIGMSKLGGCPDLPKDIKWPHKGDEPLAFIAQINFAQTTKFDTDNELSKNGMLYLFYDIVKQDAWGMSLKEKESFALIYYDGEISSLMRTDIPSNMDDSGRIGAAEMVFSYEVNIPSFFGFHNEQFSLTSGMNDFESDTFIENFCSENTTHKLLGHSNNIQNSMEDECQLVANGIDDGYNNPRSKELVKNATEWKLLMQIDSQYEKNKDLIMFGDAGRLYVWIKKDDLSKRDFSKAWFILQCY